jgi:hypothetical protein
VEELVLGVAEGVEAGVAVGVEAGGEEGAAEDELVLGFAGTAPAGIVEAGIDPAAGAAGT